MSRFVGSCAVIGDGFAFACCSKKTKVTAAAVKLDQCHPLHFFVFHSTRRPKTCRRKEGLVLMQSASPDDNSVEEPPETLFMKELRRRRISPSSQNDKVSVTDSNSSSEESNGRRGQKDVSVVDQRKQSMDLNSEGLEGLIPRAKVLLSLGGAFFIGFWPLIVSSLTVFAALYIYYGPIFIHSGSPAERPSYYVDPNDILEESRKRLPGELEP